MQSLVDQIQEKVWTPMLNATLWGNATLRDDKDSHEDRQPEPEDVDEGFLSRKARRKHRPEGREKNAGRSSSEPDAEPEEERPGSGDSSVSAAEPSDEQENEAWLLSRFERRHRHRVHVKLNLEHKDHLEQDEQHWSANEKDNDKHLSKVAKYLEVHHDQLHRFVDHDFGGFHTPLHALPKKHRASFLSGDSILEPAARPGLTETVLGSRETSKGGTSPLQGINVTATEESESPSLFLELVHPRSVTDNTPRFLRNSIVQQVDMPSVHHPAVYQSFLERMVSTNKAKWGRILSEARAEMFLNSFLQRKAIISVPKL